ncbi:MAG: DUF4340 domain-containing protein [Nibricoccus sp.]
MRTKVTLVLIFLNVVLFYVIFVMGGRIDPAKDTTGVLGPEVANIQSLTVTNASGETLTRIERRVDKWFLTQPFAWPANEFAVRNIVNELQFLRPISSFDVDALEKSGMSLATYGLEKPQITLSFTPAATTSVPNPAPVLVRLGKSTDVENRIYILSPDGKRIHVVPRSLAESLTRTLQALRSSELFTIQVFEARSLNLEPAGGSRIRFRRENDRWLIEGLSASQTRASKVNTELALGGLRELRVHSFVPPAEGEAARNDLATPSLRITIEGNNRRETLLLGRPAPAEPAAAATPAETSPSAPAPEPATLYYAFMEGEEPGSTTAARATLFTVSVPDKFLKEKLLNAQRELREKQILDLDPATLSSITLSSSQAQDELVLQRLESPAPATASAWQVVRRSPDQPLQTEPADRVIVEQLIADLLRLSAEATDEIPAFIDVPSEAQKEALGFTRPIRSITFTTTGPGNPAPIRLLIGSSQDRHTYARLASQETIYHVSDEILRETPVDPLYYRQRLLRELPASTTITSLKLTDLSNDKILLETPLPLPAETTLNRDVIEALAGQLRVLRAKTFTSATFTKTILNAGEERGWKYRLDASLMPAAAAADTRPIISTLFFADRTGGGTQLAGSTDLNVVFEVEQPLLDALFALTYGSRDPGPPPPPAPAAVPTP